MSNCKQMNLSDTQVSDWSQIFKALSNPNRLRILLELIHCPDGHGKFSATDDEIENCQQAFADLLGLAPSTVSHHFKELRTAGLLNVRREGKNLMVQVNREVLDTMKRLF